VAQRRPSSFSWFQRGSILPRIALRGVAELSAAVVVVHVQG